MSYLFELLFVYFVPLFFLIANKLYGEAATVIVLMFFQYKNIKKWFTENSDNKN